MDADRLLKEDAVAALDHELWMRKALTLAAAAGADGEVPVGAIVVHEGDGGTPRVVGQGWNRREMDADPSAHAEIVAMREAGKALGQWRLLDCTLYVTLEPCPMCAGAMVQARLARVVYGCRDPKAGAIDSLFTLCNDSRLNHRVEVVSGIFTKEAAALLKTFFAARRKPGTI